MISPTHIDDRQRDARHEYLDRWAEKQVENIRRTLDTHRRRCPYFCGGKRLTAPVDEFDDALGDTYVELRREFNTQSNAGCDRWGRPNEPAVCGLANRRLHARVVDRWRASERLGKGLKRLITEASRCNQAGSPVIATTDPIRGRIAWLDLTTAWKDRSGDDQRLLARTMIGYEPRELADVLAISDTAVRQQLFRARRQLSATLAA